MVPIDFEYAYNYDTSCAHHCKSKSNAILYDMIFKCKTEVV